MAKNKTGKHLKFYYENINAREMPRPGLCSCATSHYIEEALLDKFMPDNSTETMYSYWASGRKGASCYYKFTTLRQTTVLFMAAIAREL